MPGNSGLFISYARTDGDGFAAALRARLAATAPDIPVWQDRSDIDGGLGWWRQIEDALKRVEFLVVVMTPAVLKSEITRREWRVARQAGVTVYPVRGPGFDPGGADVPRWMAKIHCYDLDVQWETFIAHLRRGASAVRSPFMAPPLTSGFVPRQDQLAALRQLLLTGPHKEPVAITTALVGAGGFGKTTLAAALCHDDDILTAYDDGVLWATLGQSPNLQGELTRLYAALTGERPSFVSIEDAAQALSEKLEHRTALIVVDDVWDPAHLRPFCRGGTGCARVVTTRQAAVALEAQRVSVDEMKAAEAVALLLARLGEQPAAIAPLRGLAQRLGAWPLLLKLAAGAMRQRIDRGDSVAGALEYVGKALDRRGITAFDPKDAAERHSAVSSTLDVGLEQLSDEDAARCTELAIFPDDVDIPVAVVAEMWHLDAFDAEEILTRLDSASLIELDLRGGTIGLHGILHAYLASRMGSRSTSAHAALLEAWGDLHALPHPYAWRWIVRHLRGARREATIAELLTTPAWLQAKLRAAGIYALLEDFDGTSGDAALDLLSKALRLSSHVLARHPDQLVAQILGRLTSPDETLRQRFNDLASARARPWLRPLVPSLSGPGGALVRTLDAPGAVVTLVLTPAGDRIFAGVTEHDAVIEWEVDSGAGGPGVTHWGGQNTDVTGSKATDAATALVALDDGRLIVGGTRGFAICDPSHPALNGALVSIVEGVSALAATADASRLVVATNKGRIEIYDARDGSLQRTIAAHRRPIGSIAISGDGRLALSGGYDKAARLWDLNSGELREQLHAYEEGVVYAVALSADGTLALTGAADGALRVWDTASGSLRATLIGHSHRVYAVAFSADGRFALTGSMDRTVKVWDLLTGELRRTLTGHADAVETVAFTPDGRHAVSGGKDLTVRVWQLDAGEARAATQRHEGWIHALALARSGSLAVTAGQDRVIRLWDSASGRVTRELKGHADAVSAVATDADGGWLVSGSHDGTVCLWSLADDAPPIVSRAGGAVSAVTLAAARSVAVVGTVDGDVLIWDLQSRRIVKRWEAHRRAISFVGTTPHARVVVTGAPDGTITVWDANRRKAFRSLIAHADGVAAGALSPDNRHILSGGADGVILVWSFPACELLSTTQAHAGRVRSLAMAADRRSIVSAGHDRKVRVWRFPDMTPLAAFVADSAVTAVAASADGRLIVAADAQGCAHFLRLEEPGTPSSTTGITTDAP